MKFWFESRCDRRYTLYWSVRSFQKLFSKSVANQDASEPWASLTIFQPAQLKQAIPDANQPFMGRLNTLEQLVQVHENRIDNLLDTL